MELLDKIPINIQRKVVYTSIALTAADNLYFMESILSKLMNFTLVGFINIATILAIISLWGIYMIYKRRM